MTDKDSTPETVEQPEYERPSVVDYGDLRELTRATTTGPVADHSLKTGETIAGHLTTP